jgi:hypothetical protein
MRVRVTLDGAADNVLGVIGLALESGILDQMDTVSRLETDDLPELPRVRGSAAQRGVPMRPGYKRKEEYGKKFQVGTRVVVKHERADRPYVPEKGMVGTVTAINYQGRGANIEVKFDHSGETIGVPSSMLKVVRKVPLADRS